MLGCKGLAGHKGKIILTVKYCNIEQTALHVKKKLNVE